MRGSAPPASPPSPRRPALRSGGTASSWQVAVVTYFTWESEHFKPTAPAAAADGLLPIVAWINSRRC